MPVHGETAHGVAPDATETPGPTTPGPDVLLLADPRTWRAARALCERLGERAVVVVPHDLSRSGWTYRDATGGVSFATADGTYDATRLEHVVVLLHAVVPEHLPHVAPEDRGYVAREMTAFLRVWIASLTCQIWNEPDAHSLAGSVPDLALGDLGGTLPFTAEVAAS